MRYFRHVLSFVSLLILPTIGFAQANAIVPDPDPEIERKSFIMAPGFEVNLFAADPLLAKPLQINFDPAGRLWVASSEVYPQIKPGQTANDKIIILEDKNHDGKADSTTVFADGLLIPTGLEPGDGGVYVANSTEVIHLSASKPGGKADRTKVLLSGFGTEDTHHIIHTFRWGPEQALYFNQSIYIHSHVETPAGVKRLNGGGIWRYIPETNSMDVFVRGFVNTWGHHFDRYGQSFITDGAGGEGINHGVPGASYVTAVGASRILHGMNPGSPKYCGIEVLSGRHLPDDWQGNVIANDFRGHRVCRFILRDAGSTFDSREMPELIKSDHPAFRPIDVKMGPDGAIYIADWYNPIIQHGEVDFRDPRRDKTHGRIWRVTAKGRPLVPMPKLVDATVPELLEQLKAPEDWTRQNAKRVLKERGSAAVLDELAKWESALPADAEHARLEAAWVRQSFGASSVSTLKPLLTAKDAGVRAAAVRILADPTKLLTDTVELPPLAADPNPRVRMEAVRALATRPDPTAVEHALKALDQPLDPVLDYALWQTVRELAPMWLPKFRTGELTFGSDSKKLSYALQATGSPDAVAGLLKLLQAGSIPAERLADTWTLVANLGGSAEVGAVVTFATAPGTAPAVAARVLSAVESAARDRKVLPPKTVIEGSLTTLLQPDHANRSAGVRLAGVWKRDDRRELLEGIARDDSTDAGTAIQALAELGGQKSVTVLSQLLTGKNGTPALVALSGLDLNRAAKLFAEQLTAGTAPSDAAFTAFLNRKGGADALTAALAGKSIPADSAKIGLRTVRTSAQNLPKLVDALTAAGKLTAAAKEPTPEDVKQYVVDVQKLGDAARGERIYRRKELQCLTCHAIGGAGGAVGPDMTSIGASAQPDYLVESLLMPNKAVKEGYHAVEVNTLSGKLINGIKLREANGQLVLRTNDDKEISISTEDIETTKPARSLMPAGLTDSLTRQEFVDLVRFLSELGKVGAYAPNPARVVRRWQYLDPTTAATNLFRRSRVSAAAEKPADFPWVPVYTLVNGTLPLNDVPKFVVWNGSLPQAVVRFELTATVGGPVGLSFQQTTGLSVFVGAVPVDVKPQTTIEVKPGTTVVTVVIDLSQRTEGLRCELTDVPGSAARVAIVGGK